MSSPTSSLQAAIISPKTGPGVPSPIAALLIFTQGAMQYGVVVSEIGRGVDPAENACIYEPMLAQRLTPTMPSSGKLTQRAS